TSAMAQLGTRACLKMLCKLILASQGECEVAMATGYPGRVLVLVVAVQPRKPGVTGVTYGALVTTRGLVYPNTSNWSSGS
ncbi:hypothetical protein BJY52DRAFT_1309603, partial [Lactarius psammicola]